MGKTQTSKPSHQAAFLSRRADLSSLSTVDALLTPLLLPLHPKIIHCSGASMTAERNPTQRAAPQTPCSGVSVSAEAVTTRQSQTASTAVIRAAARIDFWEGQRPRLTQISSTASPHQHSTGRSSSFAHLRPPNGKPTHRVAPQVFLRCPRHGQANLPPAQWHRGFRFQHPGACGRDGCLATYRRSVFSTARDLEL
jgi:hypothetical protein